MKGSYVLVLRLARRRRVTVGRLGAFDFPCGHYLYFGSAQGGLEHRVRRHLRSDKKQHWHIDFLTATAPVVEVWCVEGTDRLECVWARAALELESVTVPAPGLGSSDCACRSPLVRLPACWPAVESARLSILGSEASSRVSLMGPGS